MVIGHTCLLIYVFFFILAAKILPVVKKQHLLLCTLLICNAAAMEVSFFEHIFDVELTTVVWFMTSYKFCFLLQALPIFLDSLVTAWGAILISVTLILLFGEVDCDASE